MDDSSNNVNSRGSRLRSARPFRRAVLRGLGVVLPPLLTIVFLLWMWNAVKTYMITPAKDLALNIAINNNWDVLHEAPDDADPVRFRTSSVGEVISFVYKDKTYRRLPSDEWIPVMIYEHVRTNPGSTLPRTAEGYYRRHFEARWFRPWLIIPLLLCLLTLVLYLLGKIIAASIGRALWTYFEQFIHHVPFISTVYGTVKKVTDVVFADNELEFNRVVAVEYPSKGLWSIGFVTGESLPAIRNAAAEPVLSVLMPTSPMPATGFTITVRKSETVELNITVDQAFQFVVSCGVVVPGISKSPAAPSVAADVRNLIESSPIIRSQIAGDSTPGATSDTSR